MADKVVTFETALDSTIKGKDIFHAIDDANEKIDRKNPTTSQVKTVGILAEEEYVRKVDVVALQTQLREVLKDLEEFNRVNEFLMVDRIIEDLKNLLGCVEAKEK